MLQQQHPSPARLGLTTTTNAPNSPSIPPPSSSSSSSNNTPTPPNPKPPPLPSIATTATTTTTTITATTTTTNRLSPSLLPLLPPLPRAHSLLLQLSSLSSHLFDSSPKLPPCFLPPPTPIPSYPLLPNPPSSSSISSIHSQLLSSVQDLQSILQFRDSLSSVSRRISTVDSSLLSFARKMNDARHLLDNLLDDYSHYRVPTKRRKTDSSSSSSSSSSSTSSFSPLAIPLDDLLSYAHRISYTTFAPPEFGAGQVPLRGALPPAPQEEQMRASQLYNASATIDLGIASVEGAGDGVVAGKPLLESLIEPTPPREELAPQPPGIPPISVPAGWRKGMPIDLPKDLPPLPPGWKPGDPIQLPPMLEASIGGGKLEEQPRLPVAAAAVAAAGAPPVVQPRQPEPIQVKYVQLDINPEDDYSSDYSSDASSDEDDED